MAEPRPNLPPVWVGEPLLSYACNLKGCCCRGWRIPFKPQDVVRLVLNLPDDGTLDRLAEDLMAVPSPGDAGTNGFRLRGVGEDGRCRFLSDDLSCGVHTTYGTDALPDICVTFPAFPYAFGDRIELHHDGLCPEVLAALHRSPGPFRAVHVPPPISDALAVRIARGVRQVPDPLLFGATLPWAPILKLRDTLVAAFGDESRPTLEVLCAACRALAELAAADGGAEAAERLTLRWDRLPAERFVGFLFDAAEAFDPALLTRMFRRSQRFGFDHVHTPGPQWDALPEHLEHWQAALLQWVDPAEQALRPLLTRYAALLYHSFPLAGRGDLRLGLGLVPLTVALALRYTAALAGCQARPATPEDLLAGAAGAEYVFRNSSLPVDGFPWFSLAEGDP